MVSRNQAVRDDVWSFIDKWPVYARDDTDPLLYLSDLERYELQNRLLRRQISWLAEASPFYRQKFADWGLQAGDIRTVDDLGKVPLTRKQDYITKPEDFILRFKDSTIYDNIWQITYTTGTTTGKPSPFYSTSYDYYAKLLQFRRRCKVARMAPRDVTVSVMPLGAVPHIAYYGVLDNSPAIGAPAVMACTGAGHPEFAVHNSMDQAIDMIENSRAVVVFSLTSFARRLLMRAQEQARDFSSVKSIWVAGEACSAGLRNDIRDRLKAVGAAEVFVANGFACTELQGTLPECAEFSGCHNSSPDLFYLEVVDEAGRRMPDGQQGLLALTHLNRRGTALLRYLTGDLVTINRETCPSCGRPGERLVLTEGSSYAVRTSDLIKVKGTLINPALFSEVMCRLSAVEEYQVLITREDPADAYSPDKLVVRVATLTDNRDLLADQIIREIKNTCEVKPVVEFADADAIYDAAAAAKARRIVDGRPRSE